MDQFEYPTPPYPGIGPDARIILFSERLVYRPSDTLTLEMIPPEIQAPVYWYCGSWQGQNVFCGESPFSPGPGDTQWLDLRESFDICPPVDTFLAGRASQVRFFHRNHKFCGRCGLTTALSTRDNARVCPGCGFEVYPRLSPAVIALVHRGQEVLLGHNSRFPRGHFSLFSGFVEAGETLEQAVVREIREEAGIEVGTPVYHASQNWPFPDALMLGFFVPWKSGEPRPDGTEITEVQWFTRKNAPPVLRPGSISAQMLGYFWNALEKEPL